MIKQTAAAILLTLVLTVGCSADPKAADEKNFVKAINAYYNQNPCILSSGLFRFPTQIDTETPGFKYDARLLDALVDIGFLTRTVKTEKIKKTVRLSVPLRTEIVEKHIYTYNLTEEGKKHLQEKAAEGDFGTRLNGFYYGRRTVHKIENFTEPADVMGLKMVQVDYTYTVTDLQNWATNEKLMAALRYVSHDVEAVKQPKKERVALILTNNGWVHEKLNQ